MRSLLIIIFTLSSIAVASEHNQPATIAIKFNQWYISQLNQNNAPVLNPDTMGDYVASETIAAIKKLYSGDSNDKDMPDADMFIKAQDWGNDWDHVAVVSSDFDAVCTNIYIAFGQKQEHVVADCLIQANGKWKIRSATLIK